MGGKVMIKLVVENEELFLRKLPEIPYMSDYLNLKEGSSFDYYGHNTDFIHRVVSDRILITDREISETKVVLYGEFETEQEII